MYAVRWSSYVDDYFLTCSADWSVKLWNQSKNTPVQSFSSAQVSTLWLEYADVVRLVLLRIKWLVNPFTGRSADWHSPIKKN